MKEISEILRFVLKIVKTVIPIFRQREKKKDMDAGKDTNGEIKNDTGKTIILPEKLEDMNTQENIFKIALSDGMPKTLAELIAAQAAHETGNFTSNVFRSCNNAFGYKALMPSIACPGSTSYKYYPTLEASVHEVTGWIKRRLNEGKFPPLAEITTPEQYANALKSAHYFEDNVSNYIAGLKRFFVTYLAPGGFLGFILFGIAFWLISKRA